MAFVSRPKVDLTNKEALSFEPIVDGVDLSAQISSLLHEGKVAPGVPLIAGATREDLGYPFWSAPNDRIQCRDGRLDTCTQADFARFVHRVQEAFGWTDAQ